MASRSQRIYIRDSADHRRASAVSPVNSLEHIMLLYKHLPLLLATPGDLDSLQPTAADSASVRAPRVRSPRRRSHPLR
eukprot:scaffold51988_cov59-Phaeocystis_antarctica.AAC.9